MALADLLPGIHGLQRPEKLELLRLLAGDIAKEEELLSAISGKRFEIWSPYGAADGAAALMRALDEDRRGKCRIANDSPIPPPSPGLGRQAGCHCSP